MNINLNHIIDQVVKDKGIDREVLVEALEAAVLSAANKKYRNTRELEAHYNDEIGEVEVFEFVTVVEEVENSYQEIDLAEAREIDPDVEVGDSLGMKMDASSFSRIAAQTAKQVIIQKVREAEREGVFNEFKDRVGELVNGIVRRYERGDLIVDLGRAEALLPHREQVPRENYRQGDRVRAYISDVRMATKGPQIILSRTHPNFLKKLFRLEVPEIYDGTVLIKGAVREAGERAKVAVISRERDVDPVGACVGMKGSRVQAVVNELGGEVGVRGGRRHIEDGFHGAGDLHVLLQRWRGVDEDILAPLQQLLSTTAPQAPGREVPAPTIEVIERTNSLYLVADGATQRVKSLPTFFALQLSGWKPMSIVPTSLPSSR